MGTYKESIKMMINEYAHYKNLVEIGGTDPFNADGISLFLVRNHIIDAKITLKNLNETYDLELPEEYHFDLPEEYPMDYLAPNSKAAKLSGEGKHYSKEELIFWRKEKSI